MAFTDVLQNLKITYNYVVPYSVYICLLVQIFFPWRLTNVFIKDMYFNAVVIVWGGKSP